MPLRKLAHNSNCIISIQDGLVFQCQHEAKPQELAEFSCGKVASFDSVKNKCLAHTVTRFGFHATIDHTHTFAQIIALANAGTPVIVSIPPLRSSLFYHGHILVVTGGNSSEVFLADSSVYNLQALPLQRFLFLWSGLTAIVTP